MSKDTAMILFALLLVAYGGAHLCLLAWMLWSVTLTSRKGDQR
jgi:hypothetical protein